MAIVITSPWNWVFLFLLITLAAVLVAIIAGLIPVRRWGDGLDRFFYIFLLIVSVVLVLKTVNVFG